MFGWGVVSSSKHFSVFPLSMLPGKAIYSYGYLSVIASLWSLWEANDLLCPGGVHGQIPVPSPSRPHASLPEGLTLPACPARGQLPHREEIIQPGLLNFSSFSSSSFKVLLTTAFSRTVAGSGDGGRLLVNPQVLSLLAQWLLMCADRSAMVFSENPGFRNVLDSAFILEMWPQQLLPLRTSCQYI